ncbi:RNA-guided endonuclease InsQ/TnpB family protein [Streptomyces sp. NPDC021093]|uniref:RNA-guided endonuclease InsQ/TnpB family protein n=1 Tax=Streptomyces sp. NPDC021093 TaxID=3365112 RepID=UPI0037B78112
MKLVVRVKLLPTPVQALVLEATLRACNRAATYAARVAFEEKVFSRNALQKLVYTDVKATFGLSAQPTVRAVKKTDDAYTTLRANLKAGNLGKAGSKRWVKATGSPVEFRPDAAQPFDDRCLSWQYDSRTVSIWTLDGRLKGLRYTGQVDQLKVLAEHRRGESDLIRCKGKWYLLATCDVPDPEVYEPVDFLGVDRGIVNLATTSDGTNHQGRRLTGYRRHHARKRAELQARGTRSATRRLARRTKKEHRHATQVNHQIAKEIVSAAQRTGRGIAVEELDGIRDRVRPRRSQRDTFSSWPFHQLGQHLEYKACRAGVPFIAVDPAYTSQRCPRCGHTERANRSDRDHFLCRRCGLAGPADHVAGVNVRNRARSYGVSPARAKPRAWGRVLVNAPVPGPD